jgi:hypothetical protein
VANLIENTYHNSNFKGIHHLLLMAYIMTNGKRSHQSDKKPQNWCESRIQELKIPKILNMSLTILYVHNFHIQALIEEFSIKI